MKNLIVICFILSAITSSCQKEVLDSSDSFSQVGSDGITHFTDLSSSQTPKSEHPFFGALEPQRYYFGIEGSAPCCGQSYTAGATINSNFTNAPSGNLGDITVGSYTFHPGANNRYGWFGGDADPETSSLLMDTFGKNTAFTFKGVSGETNPFSGTLYFPELITLNNVDWTTPTTISRNQNHTVKYVSDSQNAHPLLLKVSWTADAHLDPNTANHKYKVVTNLFLVDDNGSTTLKEIMFKDIPKKAKFVSVSIWRGNAAKDDQGIYFLVASQKSFTVELTD